MTTESRDGAPRARVRVPMLGDAPTSRDDTLDAPVWARGFRPLFLAAGGFAALVVPLWLATLWGLARPSAQLDAITWHAHEMIFGYTAAVIAGFLLTAVTNWTSRPTLVGRPLAALTALWVAGRAALVAPLPHALAAAVDLAFLPCLAAAIAAPLARARDRRNYVMVAVLAALWIADILVYCPGQARRGLSLGVDVAALLVVVFTARVVPMFTRNATGSDAVRSHPRLDRAAAIAMALYAAVDLAAPGSRLVALAALAAAALVVARGVHWGLGPALRVPLLWVLHAACAFVPLGLALRAASTMLPAVPPSAATHALTVGVLGVATLGMMARVSLGHTGRPLATGRPMVAAFAALVAAAGVRVAGPFVPSSYRASLLVAGALWTFSFAVFTAVYAPMLRAPRVDGRGG